MKRVVVATALAGLGMALCAATFAQPPSGGALHSPIPPGTLDPAAPVKPLGAALRELEGARLAAPTLQKYDAGDYAGAARLGVQALERTPENHALRYAVANSLAWTGRYEAALHHYRRLFDSPYAARARVGAAEVMRWRGDAHRAEAHYLEALTSEPGVAQAERGLQLARRALRPALTVSLSHTEDNQSVRRDEVLVSYRQWTENRRWRFEVGALTGRQESPLGARSAPGLLASAWGAGLPLAPQLDLAYYDGAIGPAGLYGTLQIEAWERRLRLRGGRVNWSRAAFSAGAAAGDLSARVAGAAAEAEAPFAALRARVDLYAISDGNRIADAELLATPYWQPLPGGVRWFGGLYGRDAKREDPRYWSPDPAYTVAFAGLRRDWSFQDGELGVSARRGLALSSTARASFSVSAAGRLWLRRDLALGAEAWLAQAPRPAPYRTHHLALFVQRLW